MSDAARPVRAADLLAHREWATRVARALVRDDHAADDLAQDLWVETLRRPPVVRTSLRGWLATALRRDVLGRRRGDERRARREKSAARPEAQPSAADLVTRAEAADRVMHAVLELDEPYRATILLRYVEDVALADIAAQSGVPVETVRTRHKRAMAMLRARLGATGDGDAWLAALAPLFATKWKAAGASSAAATTAVAGGTIMGAKTMAAACVGVAAIAGLAGGRLSAATDERPHERVAELARRVEALDVARTTTPAPRRSTSADERRAERDRRIAAIEADLDAALAAGRTSESDAERARLAALSTEELLVETQQLVKVAKYTKATADAEAVLRAGDLLLARKLDADQRAESLALKAAAFAVLGDYAREEPTLRDALAAASSPRRRYEVLKDLAYMEGRRGDRRAGAEWWFEVSRVHDERTGGLQYGRYMAATCLVGSNDDKDRAHGRDEYRALISEFGASEDPAVKKWIDMARAELARADAKDAGK